MTETAPKYRRQPRTVVDAVILLKRRYQEQCELYPKTREIPPLELVDEAEKV